LKFDDENEAEAEAKPASRRPPEGKELR